MLSLSSPLLSLVRCPVFLSVCDFLSSLSRVVSLCVCDVLSSRFLTAILSVCDVLSSLSRLVCLSGVKWEVEENSKHLKRYYGLTIISRPCWPKAAYGLGMIEMMIMMMMMIMMINLIYSEYFHQLLKGDHPLLCLVPLLGNLVQIGKQMYITSSFSCK